MSKVSQLIQLTLSLLSAGPGSVQFYTHHGNWAAKVQNPVLQGEVEPEVKVEGSCAGGLISLDRAVPVKEIDKRGQCFFSPTMGLSPPPAMRHRKAWEFGGRRKHT